MRTSRHWDKLVVTLILSENFLNWIKLSAPVCIETGEKSPLDVVSSWTCTNFRAVSSAVMSGQRTVSYIFSLYFMTDCFGASSPLFAYSLIHCTQSPYVSTNSCQYFNKCFFFLQKGRCLSVSDVYRIWCLKVFFRIESGKKTGSNANSTVK